LLKGKKFNAFILIHLIIITLYILAFLCLTFLYTPKPHSDFNYYWITSDNFNSYYKGGILPLLYSPLKTSGQSPYMCAFIINSFCWILLVYSFWLSYENQQNVWPKLTGISALVFTGIWWSGMSPIVNADLPHVAFVALGLSFLFKYLFDKGRLAYIILSILLLSTGLSIRMQGIIAFGILVIILTGKHIIERFRSFDYSDKKILLVISLSLLLALSFETFLRINSDNVKNKIRYSRTSLYVGFLLAKPGMNCGEYKKSAAEQSVRELNIPFTAILKKYIPKKKLSEVLKLVLCKLKRFLSYDHFAFAWLEGSTYFGKAPVISAPPDKYEFVKNFFKREIELNKFILLKILLFIESESGVIIKILLVALFITSIFTNKNNNALQSIAFLLIIIYLIVHSFFEIQPRYILGPVIFAFITLLHSISLILKGEQCNDVSFHK
jgi:hypothetical protein